MTKQDLNAMQTNLLRTKATDWCDNAIASLERQVEEMKRRRDSLAQAEPGNIATELSWAVNHTASLQGNLRLDLAVTIGAEAARHDLRCKGDS